jgi:uroporphyrinogen decarboxylase
MMAGYYGNDEFEAQLGNCLEVIRTRLPYVEVPGRPGVLQDEFGVHWDRSIDADIGTVCNTVITPGTLGNYKFPDPENPARFAGFPSALSERGERLAVATIAFTLFERAWTLVGMENLLMAMISEEQFVNDLLDRIIEYDMEIARIALSFDIDAMRFGDDWGQQRGLIMGPVMWRKYIGPRIAKLYGLVKKSGKRVFIHSCGQVEELFPDLIDSGVDVFNPFQPEVMDVGVMKDRHGQRLTFFGGISTQKTLPYGTPEQVRVEVEHLIERVGRDGGYIAAPAHDVPKDARPDNIAAMLDVLQHQ